jgi:hypothetical protein
VYQKLYRKKKNNKGKLLLKLNNLGCKLMTKPKEYNKRLSAGLQNKKLSMREIDLHNRSKRKNDFQKYKKQKPHLEQRMKRNKKRLLASNRNKRMQKNKIIKK